MDEQIKQLETEIENFKTSQLLGDSSTVIYPIVENYQINWTAPGGEYTGAIITFTSDTRIFPKMSIRVKSCTVNGNSTIPSEIYQMKPGAWGYTSDIHKATTSVIIGYNSSSRDIGLTVDIYADTTGTLSVSAGSAL